MSPHSTHSDKKPWHWQFWKLQQEPFSPLLRWPEDRRFVYQHRRWMEAVARMQYVAEHQFGLAILTGDSGAGKTLLLQTVSDQLARQGIHPLLYNSQPDSISRLHPQSSGSAKIADQQLMFCHQQDLLTLTDRRYVVLLDDLETSTLQEHQLKILIDRVWQNRRLGCLILSLRPEKVPQLYEMLTSYAPLLIPLRPWQDWEAIEYLQHRFHQAGGTLRPFSDQAAEQLNHLGQGNPRRLTRLAHESLLLAAEQEETLITPELIEPLLKNYGQLLQAKQAAA